MKLAFGHNENVQMLIFYCEGIMSRYLFEILQRMNHKDVEVQFVLQCAPVIVGLKSSNLLMIATDDKRRILEILQKSRISYEILLSSDKVLFFLYRKELLEQYLGQKEIQRFLSEKQYVSMDIEKILYECKKRYILSQKKKYPFPHEIGVLLGYPLEDVVGFVEQQGKNYLYNGYWKVYGNRNQKVRLFQSMEQAKVHLLQQLQKGFTLQTILEKEPGC